MGTLAKYRMRYTFDAAQHPRDDHGRFTEGNRGSGGAPSFRVRPLAEPSPGPRHERRSLTRGESWQRIGSRLAAIPASYTGSTGRETPVDFFKHLSVTWQRPKAVAAADHIALLGKLKQIIAEHRGPAIEKGKITRRKVAINGMADKFTAKRRIGALLVPENTPAGAAHRAYNHAAMLALHDAGVLRYDYKMSDDQKAELAPLEPFMRSVRQRLKNAFATAVPGHRTPYLSEFGVPFADQRRDKQTGAVRRRFMPANQQLVKRLLTEDEVRAAARQARRPTAAQAEAGNYRKGRVSIACVRMAIETAKGRMRYGGRGRRRWKVKMPAHYGYAEGTVGADGDPVDIYLGPHAHRADKHRVYVVDQVDAKSRRFDEHKAMLGFRSLAHAVRTYDAGFSDGKGPQRRGAVTAMSFDAFRAWLKGKTLQEPVSEEIAKMLDLPLAEPLTKAATPAQQAKVKLTMREFKGGRLRSWRGRNEKGGVRRGPVVRDRRQAIAIALSQAGLSKAAPADIAHACHDQRVAAMHGAADGILRKEGRKLGAGAADPHVVMVMPDMRRLVGVERRPAPTDVRHGNTMVADPRLPLAVVLGKAAPKHSAAHPGFGAVAGRIERSEHVSRKVAGAILGAAARKAGKKAFKRNPRLKRVLHH